MRNFKMIIQYDGSRYKGWQRLGDNDNTIQSKLETVLGKMTGEQIEVLGSGRTDAGVHAENQVANFRTESTMSAEEILAYCYTYLPEDIVVKSVEEVSSQFHARYNAKVKEYTYHICNRKIHDVFNRKYIYHIPETLDLLKMKQAAEKLVGEHDFQSFTTLKSKKKSTVREIYSINIIDYAGNIDIIIHGSGFMRNMVRIIVGTLVEVGLGQKKVEDIPVILEKKERRFAGPVAPAKGLFLTQVTY